MIQQNTQNFSIKHMSKFYTTPTKQYFLKMENFVLLKIRLSIFSNKISLYISVLFKKRKISNETIQFEHYLYQ